jgi:hypothetical protein
MRIIGCDLHARQQVLAMLDTTTGEMVTMTLKHESMKATLDTAGVVRDGQLCP